jgi:hypothetical protein
MHIEYRQASNLPAEWDILAGDNFYLKKDFLTFLEGVDACNQKYIIFYDSNNHIDTILMTYTRNKFNLFMFTPIKVALTATFIYVPLSVTRPGYAGPVKLREQVATYLQQIQGYKVFLNTPKHFTLPGFVQTTNFPKCVLSLRWNSLQDYLNNLRSGYRRRYKLALKRSSPLKLRVLNNNLDFDDRLYSLYEEVYNASKYRIEKLSKGFFQGPQTKILVYSLGTKDIGFVQLIENGTELIFEFVGFDHAYNKQYDTYISLLVQIVDYGIKHGFATIDFGQTADDAKLKLGCRYQPLYVLLHHSNPIIHFFTKVFINKIGYKPLDQDTFHVFNQTSST